MADLGAIARAIGGDVNVAAGDNWTVVLPDPVKVNGVLAGNVKTSGVNEPDCAVFVFRRVGMRLVARTFTDMEGNWSVSGLDPDLTGGYVVVIQDPEGGTTYNDGVFGSLTPAAL